MPFQHFTARIRKRGHENAVDWQMWPHSLFPIIKGSFKVTQFSLMRSSFFVNAKKTASLTKFGIYKKKLLALK